MQNMIRQTSGLGPEKQKIIVVEMSVRVVDFAFSANGPKPLGLCGGEKALPAGIGGDILPFAVIQASAPQSLVVQGKAQGFNQVQLAADIGAKPYDIAGIGRNFGLIQHNVQHIYDLGHKIHVILE